jgi:hypothetical protein
MANIKNLSTSNQYIDGYIDAWETKADDYVATNKTRAHAAVYLHRNNTWNGNTHTSHFYRKLTINGKNVYETTGAMTIPPKASGYVKVAEGYVDVEHESDGKKSVTISFEGADNYASSTTAFDISKQSGTLTLTNIPRKATITAAPNFNDEANPAITYSNPAGNAVTKLEACIASADGKTIYVPYRDLTKTATSYTFNLTTTERNTLRNATKNSNTLAVRFYVATTIGETIYYSSLDKTMTIVNATPTISNATVKDAGTVTTALTGDVNKIIRGYNYISASMTPAALKGATITSQSIKCGDKTVSGKTATFTNVDTATFVFTVKDSRGNTRTQTVTKTLINYVNLTCNMAVNKPTVDGKTTLKVNGNYFNGSFGAVANTLQVQYRYKENDGAYGNWINATPTITNNTYSTTVNITGLNYRNAYTFQARAIDKISTGGVNSAEKRVKATPVFDWGENDFKFNVDVCDKYGNNLTNEMTAENQAVVSSIGRELKETGFVSITPVANTPTSASVTFKRTYKKIPTVLLSVASSVPGTQVLGYGQTGISTTGFNAVVTRINTVPTVLYFFVFGEVDE